MEHPTNCCTATWPPTAAYLQHGSRIVCQTVTSTSSNEPHSQEFSPPPAVLSTTSSAHRMTGTRHKITDLAHQRDRHTTRLCVSDQRRAGEPSSTATPIRTDRAEDPKTSRVAEHQAIDSRIKREPMKSTESPSRDLPPQAAVKLSPMKCETMASSSRTTMVGTDP